MGRNIIEVIIKADNQASAKLKGVAADVKNVEASLTATGAALAVVGVAIATALAGAIFKTAEWADDLYDLSKRLGISTEFLSGMNYALKVTGGEIGNFEIGLKYLAGTLQDAINGNEEAQKKFDALGISIRDSSGHVRGAQEMFFVFADRIKNAKTSTEAMAIATNFFGRGALTLVPLLKMGSAGIKELTDRNRELGGELSGSAAAGADELMNSLVGVKTSARGAGLALLEAFGSPTVKLLENLAEAIKIIHEDFDKLDNVMSDSAPPSWWKAMFSVTPAGPIALHELLFSAHQEIVDMAEDGDAAYVAWERYKQSLALTTPITKSHIDQLKEMMALFPAAPSPIEMSLLSCARATELWDAKTMDLAGNIVAVTGAYEKVAVPAMVNPFAAEWKAGLEEFDVHGMDVARDMTNTFGDMFAQIAQKGANAAQIFEQAWRAALGNIIAMLAKMFLWKIGGEIVGTAFGVPGGGGGAILGEGAGVGKGLGKSSSPSMSSAPAVNVNPLFFSGSRQDSYLAADYIQRRLDGNSRFVIEGSL